MDFELYGHPAIRGEVFGEAIRVLAGALQDMFLTRSYGPRDIRVGVMIAGPEVHAAVRHTVRFIKIGKHREYLSILLPSEGLAGGDLTERLHEVSRRVRDEIPKRIGNCSIPNFNHHHFIRDCQEAIDQLAANGWRWF